MFTASGTTGWKLGLGAGKNCRTDQREAEDSQQQNCPRAPHSGFIVLYSGAAGFKTTAGTFWSRTNLLNPASSLVSRASSLRNSLFTRLARSSYTIVDCRVGAASVEPTTFASAASLLLSIIG